MLRTNEEVNKSLLEIAKLDSYLAKKEADLNSSLNKIKEKFEEETKQSKTEREMLVEELQNYAILNKKEFEKQRSKNMTFGTIGFRTTPPKVAQLNRKYTVKTSIELLKKLFTGKYLRTVEEMNKEEILTDYSMNKINDEKLASVGLKVDQDDRFYFEINWEKINEESN